jgi:Zn-dependent protease with chaperone function
VTPAPPPPRRVARPEPSAATPTAGALEAEYFDGQSARAHAVRLHWSGPVLQIRGDGVARDVARAQVRWAERTRHGRRVAHLSNGGSLLARDAASWDAWLSASGERESLVVSAQQSWRWTLAGVAGLAVVLGALVVWGVPWLSRVALLAIPPSVDQRLGDTTLNGLDQQLLRPSALDPVQQQRVREAFERALAAAGGAPPHTLVFRSSRIGPNAFALPGGTIVMTDQLAKLFDAEPAVLTGVLAHELGHVKHRHGMRMVVQASLIGLVSSVALGDFSSLLAGAPVLLGQQSYSRDAERDADAHSADVLRAAGISPAVMVGFFEKMNALQQAPDEVPNTSDADPSWLGIAIASHPADAERIAFFRAAAAR